MTLTFTLLVSPTNRSGLLILEGKHQLTINEAPLCIPDGFSLSIALSGSPLLAFVFSSIACLINAIIVGTNLLHVSIPLGESR